MDATRSRSSLTAVVRAESSACSEHVTAAVSPNPLPYHAEGTDSVCTVLKRLDLRGKSGDLRRILPRPEPVGAGPVAAVQAILADVRDRGDAAVRELSERFDHVVLDALRVPRAEMRGALEAAAEGIEDFHRHQLSADRTYERDGILIEQRQQPVDRAGCYVPGG